MKTFKDLEFGPHSYGGIHATIEFENGYGVSVIQTHGGKDGLYELGVLLNGKLHYNNPVAQGDVVGYCTENKISDLMKEVQEFPDVETPI